jgi:thiosulfate reductase cytochrome b subunit
MTDPTASKAPAHPDRPLGGGRVAIWRHPATVRITHWINVAVVVVLIMSGLNILMAHPHLYWGVRSTFTDPWVSFGRVPDWLMMPQGRNLAEARRWHFALAWIFVLNGLIYLAFVVLSGRLKHRLWPTGTDLKAFWPSVVEHARLRFPKGEEARAYNVIQKLTYVAILLVVLPMMLVTGLSMSPGFNAIGGVLLEIMGGRQSARTLHFLSASLIVGFILVHVALVVWTGLFNNIRAMITGWYVIASDRPGDDR